MIDIDVSKIINEIGEPSARFVEDENLIRQRKLAIIFSLSFLIVFVFGIAVFFVLSNKTMAANRNVSSDIETLKEQNNKLIETEELGRNIENRNESIVTIIKENPNWSFVLEKLEDLVPKGIIFSRFEVDSPETMRLNGSSPDYTTLSKFVVSMKNSGIFNNVNLTTASLVASKEESSVEFSVSFGSVKKINRGNIVDLSLEQSTSSEKSKNLPSVSVPLVEDKKEDQQVSEEELIAPSAQNTEEQDTNNANQENSGLPSL